MLVLSRKPSESIFLDVPPSPLPRRIQVCVVRLGPNTAKIGFTADKDVNIAREEVCKPREEWELQ